MGFPNVCFQRSATDHWKGTVVYLIFAKEFWKWRDFREATWKGKGDVILFPEIQIEGFGNTFLKMRIENYAQHTNWSSNKTDPKRYQKTLGEDPSYRSPTQSEPRLGSSVTTSAKIRNKITRCICAASTQADILFFDFLKNSGPIFEWFGFQNASKWILNEV